MNNALVRNCAEGLAKRVRPTPEKPLADAVRAGYTITLGRAATEQETTDAVQFIKDQADAYKKGRQARGRTAGDDRHVPGIGWS